MGFEIATRFTTSEPAHSLVPKKKILFPPNIYQNWTTYNFRHLKDHDKMVLRQGRFHRIHSVLLLLKPVFLTGSLSSLKSSSVAMVTKCRLVSDIQIRSAKIPSGWNNVIRNIEFVLTLPTTARSHLVMHAGGKCTLAHYRIWKCARCTLCCWWQGVLSNRSFRYYA